MWLSRLLVVLVVFALSGPAEAQQLTKIPRIGFLSALSSSSMSGRIEAFRQGLRDLGYVEGKNIMIEYRSAEGKSDRLPGLAAELVRLKVDLVVSGGPATTRAAKRATVTIPSSWRLMMTLLARGWPPASRGLVGTSRAELLY